MSGPTRSADGPFPVAVEAGRTYFWCACGRSARQPFCDGAHAGSGMNPVRYQAREDKTLHFCGCKATGKPPFCDGSHKA